MLHQLPASFVSFRSFSYCCRWYSECISRQAAAAEVGCTKLASCDPSHEQQALLPQNCRRPHCRPRCPASFPFPSHLLAIITRFHANSISSNQTNTFHCYRENLDCPSIGISTFPLCLPLDLWYLFHFGAWVSSSLALGTVHGRSSIALSEWKIASAITGKHHLGIAWDMTYCFAQLRLLFFFSSLLLWLRALSDIAVKFHSFLALYNIFFPFFSCE